MPSPQNIIGQRVKALRRAKHFTQSMLAARCGTLGWDIGENTITKIETSIRCVTDVELLCIAAALSVDPADLMPASRTAATTVRGFFQRQHN